ncbi:hypothetical protein [Xanthobacter sp.]|uniref:hypothetical protein n=1 Tax=Xanthobacter sp. TaxID=35809 RepID=UPI0025D2EBF0|nr:hypothetical protein [Xanthobacter sp.]
MSKSGKRSNEAELSDAETAALTSMAAEVTCAMNVAMQSIRTATEAQPSLVMHAAIAEFVANMAGQLAARAEFIAINAGGRRKDVTLLCGGAFQDGRSLAYAQTQGDGDIIRTNAPTTGAAQ